MRNESEQTRKNKAHGEVSQDVRSIHYASFTKQIIRYTVVKWRPLIIIADNVINRLLLSKSVVPKHSI